MQRRLLISLWYVGVSLVVTVALLFSMGRLLLPLLESHEGRLEGLVKEAVGQDTRIGGLELSWRGFGPEVRITDFALYDAPSGRDLLTARELRVGIDLWASLRAWQPVPSRLVLVGSDVSLYRDTEGHFRIEGVQFKVPHANPWLLVLSQPRVELRDIQVHWRDDTGALPSLRLQDANLQLLNRGRRHQLQVRVRLPAEYGEELQLAADLRGDVGTPQDWAGKLFIDVDGVDIARWLGRRAPGGLQLRGRAHTHLWAELVGSRLRHMRGDVDIQGLAAATRDHQLLDAERLTGQWEWRRAVDGWTLDLGQVELVQGGEAWPETGLTLAVRDQENGNHAVQLGVSYLRLELVAPWLSHLLEAAPERKALLEALQPRGEVEGLQLAFRALDGRFVDVVYQMRFDGVETTAVNQLPGGTALSGRIAGSHDHGTVDLDSRGAQLTFPGLFRDPLQLDRLQGRVLWRRSADRLRIETQSLAAENADIATESRLRLDLPLDGSRPFLDLYSQFRRGQVGQTGSYLPAGIMPPRTVAWLDRALVSGEIRSGAMLFHGHPGEFPFDQASGRMEVRATVTDAILDYGEGWHRIEGLEAELAFVNRGMHIRGVAGKILGADLEAVDVRIDDLAHARLEVDGRAHGPLADMLRFVRESPLSGGPGDALGAVQAQGPAELRLGLVIPLAEHRPATVVGEVRLAANRLALPAWELAFDQLQGDLRFTERSVTADGLKARLNGVPVTLTVDDARRDGHPATRVAVRGALPLLQWLKADTTDGLGARISGSSDWTASVDLPREAPHATPVTLELVSDLRGISVDLPAPFGKTAAEVYPLRLRTTVALADGLRSLYLQYGEHSAAAELQRQSGAWRLLRGELYLGSPAARLPDGNGLRVRGSLPRFVWDDWRPLLAPAGPDTAAAASAAVSWGALTALAVDVGELTAWQRRFRQVHVDARHDRDGWRVQLAGPDAAGIVLLPQSPARPVSLRLDHLRLPPVAGEPEVEARLSPAHLPALDAEIGRFRLGDLDLGRVTLRSHPLADGLAVDQLGVAADWMRLDASGAWTRRAGGDASRFRIDLQADELGPLLSAFGYAGTIVGGETRGEIDANWPGSPTDFALQKLEGSLALRIGAGRLVNVEAGAGRVFGLFSLQGLRRRLALDFSDVFEKGFSFDRIEGHFTLLDSDAYTNDLEIEGPAARIEISGRTGLARHDYDQLVTVIPQVQSSLPLAGALAGGPLVGAALLLADKLFGEQMEGLTRFARYQYTVTGSWEDPQLQPVGETVRGLQDKSTGAAGSGDAPAGGQ